MANNSLEDELEQLKKQLEALKRERATESAVSAETEEELSGKHSDAAVEVLGGSAATLNAALGADAGTSEDLITQFREFLDSIDKDIKSEKPTTLLLVFALGVLVGRL